MSSSTIKAGSVETNILCDREKPMLADFDWGGKDVEVSYPTACLNDELYVACKNVGDLKIRKGK